MKASGRFTSQSIRDRVQRSPAGTALGKRVAAAPWDKVGPTVKPGRNPKRSDENFFGTGFHWPAGSSGMGGAPARGRLMQRTCFFESVPKARGAGSGGLVGQ